MSTTPTAGTREAEFAAFLGALVEELEPLERRHNEAYWMASTTGDARHEEESARLDSEMRKVFARPASYQRLVAWSADGALADPLLDRQLRLLVHAHRARQIPPEMIERTVRLEKSLDRRFNTHRAELDGERVTDNRISEVLATSNDSELRRRAWDASKQIGVEVEPELLALVRLRNESARSLGFRDFYAMSLELDELDEAELFALLDRLEARTQPMWAAYKGGLDARLAKRFGVPVPELQAWHYADPFFQQAPAAEIDLDPFYRDARLETLAERFFAAIGFDIRDLLERADLYERPGKSQHAFCMSVDRGGDIRVLCNLRSNERWMGVLLHEFGHAIYDKYVDASLPWVLRGHAHVLATEASAMLFGRLSKISAWLRTWAGADPAALAREAEAVSRAVREQLLVQTRWELVMIHMERALYRDPAQDLRTLWWDLVERFQGVPRPVGRHAPDWAAKIHFSVVPVYYQNYLLGEILASQLQQHLLQRVLGGGERIWERYVASPEVGAFLRERFYHPGRRMVWRDLVTHATGRPLDAEAFLDELAGRA